MFPAQEKHQYHTLWHIHALLGFPKLATLHVYMENGFACMVQWDHRWEGVHHQRASREDTYTTVRDTPLVMCYLDSSFSCCNVHGPSCRQLVCMNSLMNRMIMQLTKSPLTHCEIYLPHRRCSYSVDAKRAVFRTTDRQYVTDLARWVFQTIFMTASQMDMVERFLRSRLGAPYDTGTMYNWLGLSCVHQCYHTRDDDATPMRPQSLYPKSETCARLCTEALLAARILPPCDTVLVTPGNVYSMIAKHVPDASLSYELPAMDAVLSVGQDSVVDGVIFAPDSSLYATAVQPLYLEHEPTASMSCRVPGAAAVVDSNTSSSGSLPQAITNV